MSVCVYAWGIFHIAFYFKAKESWRSEATLFFHERDRVFFKLPQRQTEREIKREKEEMSIEEMEVERDIK